LSYLEPIKTTQAGITPGPTYTARGLHPMPSWFDNVTAAAAVKLLMWSNGQRDRAEYDRSIDVGIPVAVKSPARNYGDGF
jgi:hypothetical protein